MKLADAVAECEAWFAYLERQKHKSIELQRLAALARTDPKEAKRRMQQLDSSGLTLYDGGRLEPAVRALVKLARLSVNRPAVEGK